MAPAASGTRASGFSRKSCASGSEAAGAMTGTSVLHTHGSRMTIYDAKRCASHSPVGESQNLWCSATLRLERP